MSETNSSVSAIEKVLLVLEASVDAPRFSDVVSRTGLAKATVHRILATLSERGFVAARPDGQYSPGPRFLSLAGAAFKEISVPPQAIEIAAALAREVHCTVHVGARTGDEIVYLARIDSNKPYRMPSRVGATIPMHCTGIGKMLLTRFSDQEISDFVVRTGLPRLTARTLVDESSLRAELERVRRDGYALDREENVAGIVCVATSFTDYTGSPSYGISISSLALEHSEEQLIEMTPALFRAAGRITEALGGDAGAVVPATAGSSAGR